MSARATGVIRMGGRWKDASAAGQRQDDGLDAMREWRWRSYTDHLQDMGYDLDGGEATVEETPIGDAAAARDRGSLGINR